MPIRLEPVLRDMATYPFMRLDAMRADIRERGVELIDCSIGEPREETPAFIRAAVCDAVEPLSAYPNAAGLPELRAAIAGWASGRFGVGLDPDAQIVPTFGSKEAVFSLAAILEGELVAMPAPAYPVYDRGAQFAGKQALTLPLTAANGFLPDLDAVDAATWARVAVLWLNYPNNPTGATAPLEFYERAAALAREHGFVLASDEAYSELYFGAPPASALQVADLAHVAVFNTLSKRSSMPGYRSGFVAGDPELVSALKRYRPNVGVAPPGFIQRAAAVAWADEEHVAAVRELYTAKRAVLAPALSCAALEHAGGDASFFLWLDAGERAGAVHAALAERGVLLCPGDFFGPAGDGYLRLALVPSLDACERAAALIRTL